MGVACLFVALVALCSASCNDGKKNGDEVDVDCGGKCGACVLDACSADAQCASGNCKDKACGEKKCPIGHNSKQCTDHGKCALNSGVCICDSGFAGKDCSEAPAAQKKGMIIFICCLGVLFGFMWFLKKDSDSQRTAMLKSQTEAQERRLERLKKKPPIAFFKGSRHILKIRKSQTTFGRGKEVDVDLSRLEKAEWISSMHFLLIIDRPSNLYELRVFGKNGVKVNGQRYKTDDIALLQPDATLEFGGEKFRFILANEQEMADVYAVQNGQPRYAEQPGLSLDEDERGSMEDV